MAIVNQSVSVSRSERFAQTSPRVLVVDDEKDLREHICEILNDAGCEAIPAASGEEALVVYRRERITLVLLDIFMPGKDGFETLTDIRRCFPQAKLILISGRVEHRGIDILSWGRKLGAQAILRKPFTPDKLLAAIAELVSVSPSSPTDAP